MPLLSLCVCSVTLSCPNLFVTPWTAAHQAPLSMEFSRKECWSVLLFPPLGNLPGPGIELAPSSLKAGSLLLSHPGSPPLHKSHYDKQGFTNNKTVIQFHVVKVHVTGEG